jgi:membrane protein
MNIQLFLKTLRDAFFLLTRSNPLILASSTAFFATFALPPIIIIIVTSLGLIFRNDIISFELFNSIQDLMGENATEQLEAIASNFIILEGNGWIAAGVFLFFIFAATTLLVVIHDSIHLLWRISVQKKNKFRTSMMERFKAITLILSIGVLFLLTLLFDTTIAFYKDNIHLLFNLNDLVMIKTLHFVFAFLVITLWFSLVFKVLPNAFVPWKIALSGGIVTSVLFGIGKIALHRFLVRGSIVTIFGASGSFALILLFIFYTSFIFYYGASFTYMIAKNSGQPIKPGKHADLYVETILNN